jgi:hypothetical protein
VNDDSPRTLKGYFVALGTFLSAYDAYLRRPNAETRLGVTEALPAASNALSALGFNMAVMPPPALGGYPVRGIYNVAFVHERTMWGSDAVPLVFDTVQSAQAEAKRRVHEAERRRRNPLYWGDRVLRAILGFPVYLVGLIVAVPSERLRASAWGSVLQVAGVVAEIALAVVGGAQVGWW